MYTSNVHLQYTWRCSLALVREHSLGSNGSGLKLGHVYATGGAVGRNQRGKTSRANLAGEISRPSQRAKPPPVLLGETGLCLRLILRGEPHEMASTEPDQSNPT